MKVKFERTEEQRNLKKMRKRGSKRVESCPLSLDSSSTIKSTFDGSILFTSVFPVEQNEVEGKRLENNKKKENDFFSKTNIFTKPSQEIKHWQQNGSRSENKNLESKWKKEIKTNLSSDLKMIPLLSTKDNRNQNLNLIHSGEKDLHNIKEKIKKNDNMCIPFHRSFSMNSSPYRRLISFYISLLFCYVVLSFPWSQVTFLSVPVPLFLSHLFCPFSDFGIANSKSFLYVTGQTLDQYDDFDLAAQKEANKRWKDEMNSKRKARKKLKEMQGNKNYHRQALHEKQERQKKNSKGEKHANRTPCRIYRKKKQKGIC